MTRTILRDTTERRVALLATGDEICSGDILNSNARDMARQLVDHGIASGVQMSVSDHIDEIEIAIHHLLAHHDALIITGGLGPTSDDLTRFALGRALDQTLVFYEPVWDAIVARLIRFGYNPPPESNRQQALFPANVTIIPNDHGTAAGCAIKYQKKLIFMLPGPPSECMPMLQSAVLPMLTEAHFCQTHYRKSWLLFGVSEGKVAEELDAIAAPWQCTTGYRIAYPYVEFKIYATSEADFNALVPLIEAKIAPWLIGNGRETASAILRAYLPHISHPLRIHDASTGGLLEHTLKTPQTKAFVEFVAQADAAHVSLQGLDAFWQMAPHTHTELVLRFHPRLKLAPISATVPLRGDRVRVYATEFTCRELARLLPMLATTLE